MTTGTKPKSFEHIDEAGDGLELKASQQKEEQTWHHVDEAWLAREKRLVRKLDYTLMPTIWVLYLFNYLDRNNIA